MAVLIISPGPRRAGIGPFLAPGRQGPRSAVAADILAELPIDLGGLLDPVVEHGSPLRRVLVERYGAEQEAGLEHDFERVAEIVREAADFFCLRFGNGARWGLWGHKQGIATARITRQGSRTGGFDTSGCLCNTRSCCPSSAVCAGFHLPKWRNWQTRMVQVHVPARVWGFESLLRHQHY